MSQLTDKSFIGKGELHAAVKIDGQLEYIFLGNCSNLQIEPQENRLTQPDYTSAGGGNRAVLNRVTDVNISMTLHELRTQVLEIAARATGTKKTKTTVTDEVVVAKLDRLIPLEKFADPAEISVTKEGQIDPFVSGVDYEPRAGGIYILSDGDITEGAVLKVTYDTLPHTNIEALTRSNATYALWFNGINEAQDNAPTNVWFHSARFGLSGLDFISDEFASFEVSGELIADPSITGADVSRFYRVQMAD